jgi:hypothetical protein
MPGEHHTVAESHAATEMMRTIDVDGWQVLYNKCTEVASCPGSSPVQQLQRLSRGWIHARLLWEHLHQQTEGLPVKGFIQVSVGS